MTRQRSSPGFTLIEMLVVLTIISILSAMVLGAVAAARRLSKVRATEARIKLIEAALDRYEGDFKDYPPSDGDTDGIKGASNLYFCLKTDKKDGPYLVDPNIKTVDAGNGSQGIADEWNHAIRYIHHRDYRNAAPNKHTFRLISPGNDGEYNEGAKDSDDIVNWNKDRPE